MDKKKENIINKYKNPNDIKKIVDNMNIEDILNNNIDNTNISSYINIINPLIKNKLEIPINYNFITIRIYNYNIWKEFNKNKNIIDYCNNSNFKIINMDINQYKLWNQLSLKVEKLVSINFPLIYEYKNNICKFENILKNSNFNLNNLKITNPEMETQILFQKILIMYTLKESNISSKNYKFIISSIPSTIVVFQVYNIYFKFNLSYQVILDPETKLDNFQDLDYNYLLYLNITDNNFLYYFLNRFTNYLYMDNLIFSNNLISLCDVNIKKPIIGDLIFYKNNNNYYTGVIIETLIDNIEIIFFILEIKKPIRLIKKTVHIDDIYEFKNIYPSFSEIVIGNYNLQKINN